MSFGWIDPKSVNTNNGEVTADFVASDGKTKRLRMAADVAAIKLVAALDEQAALGVINFDPSSVTLNSARNVRGVITPTDKKSGLLETDDGQTLTANFPDGSFDDSEPHKVSGVAAPENDEMNFFVSVVGPYPDSSMTPGL